MPAIARAESEASSQRVRVQVTDQFGPEAIAGLSLYARLTGDGERVDGQIVARQRWFRWYRENPYGPGLFALAHHGEEVVGVYSLIPIEMITARERVRGAKAEAFAVHPEFRRIGEQSSNMLLPLALVAAARDRARDWGIDASFGVSTPQAAACHLIAKYRPLAYAARSYTLYLSRPVVGSPRTRLASAAIAWGAKAYGQLGRAALRFRHWLGRRAAIQRVARVTELPLTTSSKLELVSSSPSMLAFRFPDHESLAYRFEDAAGKPGFMIFSRPSPGRHVKLLFWSTLALPPTVLDHVLWDVLEECAAQRAASLQLEIPESQCEPVQRVCRFGFLCRRFEQKVLLHVADWSAISTNADDWNLTAIHTAFF
jgi:GNAT superfamily N-acetyltransferase